MPRFATGRQLPSSPKLRVALMVETSSSYGRELLGGIARSIRVHDQWSVVLNQFNLSSDPTAWASQWNGDGVISRLSTPDLADRLAQSGLPVIELTDRFPDAPRQPEHWLQVRSDDAAIGRLAAEHLLERGFRAAAFCGFRDEAWSRRRGEAFAETMAAAGAQCATFESPWAGSGGASRETHRHQLMEWVRELPRPVGVMACNDLRGQEVLTACGTLGVSVPEEIAVIGVDNDDLMCRICSPPLSSVVPNAGGIGFLAAEQLHRMMHGEFPQERRLQVAPLGIATRQSTDVMAIDDTEIAEALRFIREHACRGIRVEDVVQHVGISRSKLERQLRKLLQRSPQQEIRQVQVKRAQELLATTDLSIEKISQLVGFQNPEYLHVVFKRLRGQTPGRFRAQSQML